MTVFNIETKFSVGHKVCCKEDIMGVFYKTSRALAVEPYIIVDIILSAKASHKYIYIY